MTALGTWPHWRNDMLSPPVMMIEMAADSLKDVPEWLQDSQRRELYSFGPGRASKLGATLSDDFRIGYELGLATARTILRGSAVLALAKVKPEDVL